MPIDRRQFKGTSIFVMVKEQIRMQFSEFKEFVDEVSTDLQLKVKKVDADYKTILESDPESEDLIFLIEDYRKYQEMHSKFLFNPMLLSIYGYFEIWLKKVCDYNHGKRFSNITVSDLAGQNYIERSRIYLEKVAEISLDDLTEEWTRIKQIQNIRNLIAHNFSNVIKNSARPVNEQSFFQLLKNEQYIYLDEQFGDFYIEDKRFIHDVVDLMQKYLFGVIDKVAQIQVKAKNTTLPYDMGKWGIEKTEALLLEVISGLEILDNYEKRDDEHRLEDTLFNVRNLIGEMSWNLTKMYSFFTNGKWGKKDKDLIVIERKEGLEKLKKYYTNKHN
ncbi:hypothetical protein JYB64_20700 [Algoriphagus aestuarii]|nr:hypothetical protein [Algoriphagus aestuarii]